MPRAFRFDLHTGRLSETTVFPSDSSLLWTSRPYPLEVIESMATEHACEGGFMWQHDDALDTVHQFADGALVAPPAPGFVNYPAESLNTVIQFDSGELDDVLKSYTAPPESIDTLHQFMSGELDRVLIEYMSWPIEGINTTHGFDSGALT